MHTKSDKSAVLRCVPVIPGLWHRARLCSVLHNLQRPVEPKWWELFDENNKLPYYHNIETGAWVTTSF
jgi:hypothetical protein